jgi:hypothetical protein
MTLTADQRRALALLANADGNGATQQLLAAHCFAVPVVAGLVKAGSLRDVQELNAPQSVDCEHAFAKAKGLIVVRGFEGDGRCDLCC